MPVAEPLENVIEQEGRPLSFQWRGQRFRVSEFLDSWTEDVDSSWKLRKREKRRYFRVHAEQYRTRITAELYAAEKQNEVSWLLSNFFE